MYSSNILKQNLIDKLGAIGSTICVAHCAICVFFPSILSMLGLVFLIGHEAEWFFTIATAVIASAALWFGYKKHQSKLVVSIMFLGISGLFVSRFLEESISHNHQGQAHELGALVGISAGLFILFGHLFSIRKSNLL